MSLQLLTAIEMTKNVISFTESNLDDHGCHYIYLQQSRCPRLSLELLTAIELTKVVIRVTDSNRGNHGCH